jgi:ABC-type dipeptide/oligopeptide/nickel transport system permease component
MLRFLFWRFLQGLVVLWAVYTITFVLLMITPGDPFLGEKNPPPAVRKALAEKYGLGYLADPNHASLTLAQRTLAVSNAYFSTWAAPSPATWAPASTTRTGASATSSAPRSPSR